MDSEFKITPQIKNDLQACLNKLENNWDIQTNRGDEESNFIYEYDSLTESLNEINSKGVNKQTALHRWYNYITSIACEYLFCEYPMVKHHPNKYCHDIDIYINSTPFDVKLTVYPKSLREEKPYDLSTRDGKNQMIKWFYENQSQGNRKQMVNRIYVVCDAETYEQSLAMKCEFDVIREQIKNFLDDISVNGFNKITIRDESENYDLLSDIVYVT